MAIFTPILDQFRIFSVISVFFNYFRSQRSSNIALVMFIQQIVVNNNYRCFIKCGYVCICNISFIFSADDFAYVESIIRIAIDILGHFIENPSEKYEKSVENARKS